MDNEETVHSQVAEVISIFQGTVLDVAHVGGRGKSTRRANLMLGAGAALMLAGGVIFASEVANVSTQAAVSDAATSTVASHQVAAAAKGAGFADFGIALLLLGLVPFVGGVVDIRDKNRTDYTIGEGHDASFHVPTYGLPDSAAFPLVRATPGEMMLNFTASMSGDVTIGRARFSLQSLVESGRAQAQAGYYSYPLAPGARCRVRHDQLSFYVNAVQAGTPFTARGDWDVAFLGYLGATGSLAATLLLLLHAQVDALNAFDLDDEARDTRFARYLMQPDELPAEDPPVFSEVQSQEEAGGSGKAHAGESGKMGNPKTQKTSGLYALKGPKDAIASLARDFDPDRKARSAGILGVMQESGGSFLASVYGGATAVGNQEEDVWGGLTGTEIGEAKGLGGLRLVGVGIGGGGTGENTVGLDSIGLIGHGGGGGPGSSYGRGGSTGFGNRKGGRVPKVHVGRSEVSKGVDGDIIRRIVRTHTNEISACYNHGLARNPNLEGRVVVQFMILASGAVGTSVVRTSSLSDSSVANCIAQTVKRWKFPKPKGSAAAMVTYPFNMTHGV